MASRLPIMHTQANRPIKNIKRDQNHINKWIPLESYYHKIDIIWIQ